MLRLREDVLSCAKTSTRKALPWYPLSGERQNYLAFRTHCGSTKLNNGSLHYILNIRYVRGEYSPLHIVNAKSRRNSTNKKTQLGLHVIEKNSHERDLEACGNVLTRWAKWSGWSSWVIIWNESKYSTGLEKICIIVGTAVRQIRGKVGSFSLDRSYVVGAKGRFYKTPN